VESDFHLISYLIIQLQEVFTLEAERFKMCLQEFNGQALYVAEQALGSQSPPLYPLLDHSATFFILGRKTCIANILIDYLSIKMQCRIVRHVFTVIMKENRIFLPHLKSIGLRINNSFFEKECKLGYSSHHQHKLKVWHSYCNTTNPETLPTLLLLLQSILAT
jgi:hypothetical protein